MVKVREDLTGKTFGRLKVIRQVDDYISPRGNHYSQWECECSCVNKTILCATGNHLKKGAMISCGCLKKERTIQMGRNNKKQNKYDLSGEYGVGWTSNTNEEFFFDLEDYDLIKDYCWRKSVSGYVICTTHYDNEVGDIKLHRLVTGYQYDIVDHIDRNKLNNRKSNLRECTCSQNNTNKDPYQNNTSGYIGVYWVRRESKWISSISIDNRTIYLGSFINKKDAIKARLRAEAKYYGEFAPQKHLFEKYGIKENTTPNNFPTILPNLLDKSVTF